MDVCGGTWEMAYNVADAGLVHSTMARRTPIQNGCERLEGKKELVDPDGCGWNGWDNTGLD
jgi:hypothetical protein